MYTYFMFNIIGEVSIYDCVRVPRKLNARSSAIWRRYLYIVPLQRVTPADDTKDSMTRDRFDIDAEAVTRLLKALEGHALPYNAFAYQEDRNQGDGMRDLCTLHRARAYLVDLDLKMNSDGIVTSSSTSSNAGLCIELVGDRFLRQMVRRIVSTAVHESQKLTAGVESASKQVGAITDDEYDNILVNICRSNNRRLAQPPFPGEGLCLAGVGFDTVDLSFYRFMPKEQKEELLREHGLLSSPYDKQDNQSKRDPTQN